MFTVPRAVLFDVDGTLLDTTEFIYQGFEHALATHGFTSQDRAALARVMGQPLADCYTALAPGCDPDLLCETHRTWQQGNLHLSVPYPDAESVLQRLRAAGVRLAAITSRSRRTSLHTLDQAGLAGYLELILSAEDVARVKPDPDGLLRALSYLNIPPAEAVMVGDTDADIVAGRAAGVRTVGVSYGFHGAAMADHAPDALIGRLGELLPLLLGAGETGITAS